MLGHKFLPLVIVLLNICLSSSTGGDWPIDANGYVVYCPCMGRFGNQADHFLGSLAFAHDLNRTLILPPWVEYVPAHRNAQMKSFAAYFDVDSLRQYHRVILMEDFMEHLANEVWPLDKRFEFCWSPRESIYDKTKEPGCQAKDGNPFGPFWDHHSIEFTAGSRYFASKTGGFATSSIPVKRAWQESFPPEDYPVLAFVGAPAVFPVDAENRHLHKYLKWSSEIRQKSSEFIRLVLRGEPFLGIHLRNDLDWNNVCKHVTGKGTSTGHLFASPQCLGYSFEHGRLTMDMCQPSEETIINQVLAAVDKYSAKSVFVSADRDPMIMQLRTALKSKKELVTVHEYPGRDPHVSLAILAQSTHYISNCVSSFSAFAARERLTQNKGTNDYWAFPKAMTKTSGNQKKKSKKEL